MKEYLIKSATGLFLDKDLSWKREINDAHVFSEAQVDDIRNMGLSFWQGIMPAYVHEVKTKDGIIVEYMDFLRTFWTPEESK